MNAAGKRQSSNQYEATRKKKLDNSNNYYMREKENSLPQRSSNIASTCSKSQTQTKYVRQVTQESSTSTKVVRSTRYSQVVTRQSVASSNLGAIPKVVTVSQPCDCRSRAPLSDLNERSNSIRTNINARQSNADKKPNYTLLKQPTVAATTRRLAPSTTIRRPIPSATSTIIKKPISHQNVSSLHTIREREPEESTIYVDEPTTLRVPDKDELSRQVTIKRGTFVKSPSIDDEIFYTAVDDADSWLTCHTDFDDHTALGPYKKGLDLRPIRCTNFQNNTVLLTSLNASFGSIQIIHDGIPSLRKKTLKKHLAQPSQYRGVVNLDNTITKVHPSMLYTCYINDIIINLLDKERKYVLKTHFISQKEKMHIRTAVVNWLIKLQQYLNSDSSVFLLSVRLFDKLLSSILTDIPNDILQLVGITTYWISCKLGDIVECISAPSLLKLCNNAFTVKDLLKTEQKVLRILNFNISVDEPLIFVRYYIFHLKLADSNTASHCANYLLDCLALDSECNTILASKQAAAALFLSLRFLDIDLKIWETMQGYPGYYSGESMSSVFDKIFGVLVLVQNPNYEFREPFNKYANEKFGAVSVKVYRKISSWD